MFSRCFCPGLLGKRRSGRLRPRGAGGPGLPWGQGLSLRCLRLTLANDCSVFDRGPSRARPNEEGRAPRPDKLRLAIARNAGQSLCRAKRGSCISWLDAREHDGTSVLQRWRRRNGADSPSTCRIKSTLHRRRGSLACGLNSLRGTYEKCSSFAPSRRRANLQEDD